MTARLRHPVLALAAVALIPLAGSFSPAAAASSSGPNADPGQLWHWPLAVTGQLTRGFEPPATLYGPGHRGIDLTAAPGTVVVATAPGIVGYAGPLADRGVVMVRHGDGSRTTYEPVSSAVQRGERVGAGEALGVLQPGHHCEPTACLHLGLIGPLGYLDPLPHLWRGPTRLLPRHAPSGSAENSVPERLASPPPSVPPASPIPASSGRPSAPTGRRERPPGTRMYASASSHTRRTARATSGRVAIAGVACAGLLIAVGRRPL